MMRCARIIHITCCISLRLVSAISLIFVHQINIQQVAQICFCINFYLLYRNIYNIPDYLLLMNTFVQDTKKKTLIRVNTYQENTPVLQHTHLILKTWTSHIDQSNKILHYREYMYLLCCSLYMQQILYL